MKLNLTYTTKRRLQRIGLISLIVLIVSILVWFCWVIWLERYMVFSAEGAALNFELGNPGNGQIAAPPSAEETVAIYYNEGEAAISDNTVLSQISGYYIDLETLTDDVNGVRDIVATLPSGSAVMVELKSAKGNFYYSSKLADAVVTTAVSPTAVDQLITDITSRNLYAIAVLPAFRDYNYGLNHVSSGLAVPKGYLWADDDYCYWLDPTDVGTTNWLRQIIEELRGLGFDEVVFSEFCFPNTDSIVFDGDKVEAISKAAASLVSSSATNTFAVSFMTSDSSFTLPQGRSRLYLENVGAKNAETVASQMAVTDPAVNLVFMATTNDTRFDAYSVLRPINTISVD